MPDLAYTSRSRQMYQENIRAKLQEQFSYKNEMQIPRLEKVVLNMGVGETTGDTKIINSAASAMETIAGQKPVIIKAKKSVATFKLREGMPIGVKVTLRRDRMYEFIDRLIYVALPRVRDFRGLNGKSFDGNGNFAMGIKEHIVFPEIDYDSIDHMWGMDVIVCTSAENNEEAKALLTEFQFPFVN